MYSIVDHELILPLMSEIMLSIFVFYHLQGSHYPENIN